MSKNTSSSGFRKVDVDAYSEDKMDDDDKNEVDEKGPNENEIKNLLAGKKNLDALNLVLKSAPLNTKKNEIKESAFQVVLSVLKSFSNSNEIENAVKSLDSEQIDVLMKYIYKGFDKEPKSSNTFLSWHEKVYAIGGSGCIIRVLSDRKRV